MSTVAAPVAAKEWTTPRLMKTGLLAVCVASLLLMAAAISGARGLRHSMQVVGRDSAPSIVAAQQIRAALADMDANAADELLGKDHAANAIQEFEKRRREAIAGMIAATRNITYGDEERQPLEKLEIGLGSYTAQIQKVRDMRAAGEKAWIEEYHAAEKMMDETLLPAALDLDHANRAHLDEAYAARRSVAAKATLLAVLAGLLTGGLLIMLQMMLAQRMRRLLNPLLIGATMAAFVVTVNSVSAFRSEEKNLKVATQDAFESIHKLWQARSTAYSAHGDEARYLLDGARTAEYQNSFREKTERTAHGTTGYLADELNNITFEGEKDVAAETMTRFIAFLNTDAEMRKLEQSGKHPAAVEYYLSREPGRLASAFESFDDALGRTLKVNQEAFDRAVTNGFADVAGFELLAPAGAFVIVLLTFLGLRPRLREYYS